jgi:dihydroorotate dehydrogenase
MGWYSAVGRPLLFALPPETAHRIAGATLALPLPWRWIGRPVDDPRLATTLAGIPLRNPIGLAAGFDKTCAHLEALGELGFGYVVGGTITLQPRLGKPKPRIVRYPRHLAMANAMGLPNPGAERAAAMMAGRPRTAVPRIVSLADEEVRDAVRALEYVEPFVDAVELNASSPNAGWSHEAAHVRDLVRALCASTSKPLFVKLPPFVTGADRDRVLAMATAAAEGGASGLTCSNTRPVVDPRLGSGRGGLSGRPLFERTPGIVREIRRVVGGSMPINASGGVSSADDVAICLEAGATTVQIYSSFIYRGPGVVGELTRGLAEALRARAGSVVDHAGTAGPAA